MSIRQKPESRPLVEQQAALTSYLEALLQEVPETLEARQAPPPEATPETSRPAPQPELVPELVPAAPRPAEPAPETAVTAAPAEKSAAPIEPPAWGQQTFQCLAFKVAGLSLAVPLVKLNGVIPWQEVTPMPNRSALFLGLLRHQGQNVKVVDTALVVVPEHLRTSALAAPDERVHHIILMEGGRWGLACDSIGEVLTLESSDVRWRTAQGRRPWLAGTVLQHLCALLDVDALVHLLATGESSGVPHPLKVERR